VQVPAVDLRALPAVLARVPAARIQVLNASLDPRDETLAVLARSGKVHFDFANVEGVGGLARMLQRVGRERVVFGSHFPLFYPESALLKIRESALKEEEVQAVRHANARTLLPRS
jgi:predicted TIM-barrel fold metal-dependent hydrolase